jgi:hypothetical protein
MERGRRVREVAEAERERIPVARVRKFIVVDGFGEMELEA